MLNVSQKTFCTQLQTICDFFFQATDFRTSVDPIDLLVFFVLLFLQRIIRISHVNFYLALHVSYVVFLCMLSADLNSAFIVYFLQWLNIKYHSFNHGALFVYLDNTQMTQSIPPAD